MAGRLDQMASLLLRWEMLPKPKNYTIFVKVNHFWGMLMMLDYTINRLVRTVDRFRDHMFSMITKFVSVRNKTRPLALNISVEVAWKPMFIRALVSKLCSTTIISAMFSVIHLEIT